MKIYKNKSKIVLTDFNYFFYEFETFTKNNHAHHSIFLYLSKSLPIIKRLFDFLRIFFFLEKVIGI